MTKEKEKVEIKKSSKPLIHKIPKRKKIQTAEGWKRSQEKQKPHEQKE